MNAVSANISVFDLIFAPFTNKKAAESTFDWQLNDWLYALSPSAHSK